MFLELRQLSVHYPGRAQPAVDAVSMGLARGQIGVLLGPSGCGKTTLLRTIAGLEPHSQGTLVLAGRALQADGPSVSTHARKVGMVFQDYALFPHMSVADNVAYGLHGMDREAVRERVQTVLDWVDLAGYAQRMPHALSGGQQQRVALARALAPQPDILLLDEPFSNLDVTLRERLASDVRAILKQAHTTALVVTHDQQEALAMGDMVGVMHQGRLPQWDDPYTVCHRPATRWVANFVGQGVWLPATLSQQGGRVVVDTPLGLLSDMQTCPVPSAYPGGVCDLLVRADDVLHDDDAPTKARIVRKVFRGAEFLYTLALPSGAEVLAHVPSHHDHAIGEFIGVTVSMDHVVTFAPEPA